MRENRNPMWCFLDGPTGMEPLVIDWAKEEAKKGIFMFIANNSNCLSPGHHNFSQSCQ